MNRNFKLEEYYEELAVDTVIGYAREQGIKLRRSDFILLEYEDRVAKGSGHDYEVMIDYGLHLRHESYVESSFSKDYKNGVITVNLLYKKGKAAARVKGKEKAFYNYRCAIVGKDFDGDDAVIFSFTKNDLDIIASEKDGEKDKEKMESIINKISKLLTYTEENGCTEAEAISASMMAQKLLAKYHLSMADVRGEGEKEDITQVTAFTGTGKKWKYRLASAVANSYACQNYYVGSEKIVFYGYESDALAARRVFVYLFEVGNRLAGQYVRKRREENEGKKWYEQEPTLGVFNSFVDGFCQGVQSELEKQCTALALVIQPEVQSAWEDFSAKFGTIDTSFDSSYDMEAIHEGYAEGKRALRGQYITDGEEN